MISDKIVVYILISLYLLPTTRHTRLYYHIIYKSFLNWLKYIIRFWIDFHTKNGFDLEFGVIAFLEQDFSVVCIKYFIKLFLWVALACSFTKTVLIILISSIHLQPCNVRWDHFKFVKKWFIWVFISITSNGTTLEESFSHSNFNITEFSLRKFTNLVSQLFQILNFFLKKK